MFVKYLYYKKRYNLLFTPTPDIQRGKTPARWLISILKKIPARIPASFHSVCFLA